MKRELNLNYQNVILDVKHIILKGRDKAYQAASKTMVLTYWNIGRRIVEDEQHGQNRAEYGKQLIQVLAEELTQEFGKDFPSEI